MAEILTGKVGHLFLNLLFTYLKHINTMTNVLTTPKRFTTYSAYAKNWLIENEIKLKTVYVEDGNYNPYFIYLNRVGNGGKPKFRILQRGKDKVKNCLMITFNTEKHNRDYLCYLLQSKMAVIRQWAHGTCQQFINQDTLAQVISGAVDSRGRMNESVLY